MGKPTIPEVHAGARRTLTRPSLVCRRHLSSACRWNLPLMLRMSSNLRETPLPLLLPQKNPFTSLLNNDFLQDYQAWGEDFVTSVGNMTCVMQEMGYLTEEREINMDHYENFESTEGYDASKSLAGQDPELMMKFKNAFSDCKAIADSWPQSSLNKNPITKAWGRNMIFFKCAHKAEK